MYEDGVCVYSILEDVRKEPLKDFVKKNLSEST
jgi:hypothetical protein